jgi:hypothetical protein
VVGSPVPFHWTVELEIKLLPVAVRVKVEPPAVAELGLMEERMGTGLPADVPLLERTTSTQ